MRGSCLCGTITYEIDRLDSPIGHCSCRTCRKAHAAAFNSSAVVKREHFRWLKGAEALKAFESSPGKKRWFCGECGSQLIAQRAGIDVVVLRVATLDDDPGERPRGHIWTSHQVPWLEFGPQLPAFPESTPPG
jgi:hypothetical protein